MKKLPSILLALSFCFQFTVAFACQSMHSPEKSEKKVSSSSHCHQSSSKKKSEADHQMKLNEPANPAKELEKASPSESCPICNLGICIESTKLVLSHAPAKLESIERPYPSFSLQEIISFTFAPQPASRAPPGFYAFIPLAEHKNWQAFFSSFLI